MLILYSYGGPAYGAPPEGGPGTPQKLELVSPDGTRYLIASWPDNVTAPGLMNWSPDGTRALLETSDSNGNQTYEQMTLATGAVSPLRLPRGWYPLAYTTPQGLNIVAEIPGGASKLARFDLAGHLERQLGKGGGILYTPDGTAFVTGTGDDIRLVSNTGIPIRLLPVLTTGTGSCYPVRWWAAGTVLADCTPKAGAPGRLWLVPIAGQRPTALSAPSVPLGTPVTDAWRLGSDRYLQCYGASDYPCLIRQAANGTTTPLEVAGSTGTILGTSGSGLLIVTMPSLVRSGALLWYDPATGAERWLVQGPAEIAGVTEAIPFRISS
jgi:hypothetical protein